jgi:indolepyruvate ferredoxin oxidoreductase
LRDTAGVTVLIYDQTCAAEKRRRRKKGEFPDPDKRLFINEAVCEGCGDCGVQSNCLSVEPVETPLGRKRRIEQSSCNKDYSCVNGFCPSFVTVLGGELKKPAGAAFDVDALAAKVAALPRPVNHLDNAPYDILVTGVGGTGVVTVGALISMAAHLEGKSASVLDFMGFAQKGGAVLSFVRFAATDALLNQVRIDTQQADLLLACDMVVGASADALQTVRHGRTRIVVNTHPIATASFVNNPDADLHAHALVDKMRHAAGDERLDTCDAQGLAQKFLGDTIGANILMLGYAWQLGLVPVSLDALMRAIELNKVAVDANKLAFSLGRVAAGDAGALDALLHVARENAAALPFSVENDAATDVDAVIADREARLAAYGGATYVKRFRALVDKVREAERRLGDTPARAAGVTSVTGAGEPPVVSPTVSASAILDASAASAVMGRSEPLTRAVATTFYKLLAVKDEYEVARLYSDGTFRHALEAQFAGIAGRDFRIEFNMAPPAVTHAKHGERPKKVRFGQWMWPVLGTLAKVRALRGTPLDPFGRTLERRMERALASDYEATIGALIGVLSRDTLADAVEFAQTLQRVRGYGPVKLTSVVAAKARERALARTLGIEPATGEAVRVALERAPAVGALRGIPVAVRS